MMMAFLSANWGTILVGILVLAVVVGVIVKMRKDKAKGKNACGCGGGCSSCPSAGMCHKK